jgi:hypothetical protein
MTVNGTVDVDLVDDLTEVRELVQIAMQGAEANDRPDLVRRLTKATELLVSVCSTAAAAVHQTVVDTLEDLENDLRARRAMLSDPSRGTRLIAELHHAQNRLSEFEERSAEWHQILSAELAAASSGLESDIGTRLEAVLAEATAGIESGELTGAGIDDWLRARLQAEVEVCYEQLRAAVQLAGSQIETRLELPIVAPAVDPLLVPPTDLATEAGAQRRAGTPAARSAMLVSAGMAANGGAMMSLSMPLMVGMHLHGWSSILFGTSMAGMMTSITVAMERRRQNKRIKGEDIAGLGVPVESFRLALIKQVRDVERSVRQDLGQAVGRAVAEQGQTLTAEVDGLRRAADVKQTTASLHDIGDDLTRVGALRDRAEQVAVTAA